MNLDINLLDIFCDFVKDDKAEEGSYVCKNCGNKMLYITPGDLPMIPCVTKLSKPIHIPEGFLPPQPRWYEKAYNFGLAIIKHLMTGAKRTTLEERTARLNICTACEYYDGIACTQCGCPITRYQQYISKLDWKDQKCPIGKW